MTLLTKELLSAVSFAASATNGKSNPILSFILMRVGNGEVRFMGSDGEIWMEHKVISDSTDESEVCLPAKQFKDFLATVTTESISMTLKGGKLEAQSGRARSSIPTVEANEFPKAPTVDGLEVGFSGEQLKLRLSQVLPFAAKETEERAQLRSVTFEFTKDGLELVVSDGRRIAMARIICKGDGLFMVPAKLAQTVLGNIREQDVDAVFSRNLVRFSTGEWTITGRLFDAKPINFRRHLREDGQRILIDRKEFTRAIKAASVFTNDQDIRLFMEGVNGEIKLTTGNKAHEDVLDAECGEFEAVLPPDNLLDILGAIQSEKVAMRVIDKLTPVYFDDVDFTALISQMRKD